MVTLPTERGAIIVVGLAYGDEAKGATVDALASHIPDTVAVARWSGGPQAAHNVVHGPRHHTFRQFGAATLQNVATILMPGMLVDPLMLEVEAHQLEDLGIARALSLVTVDPRCLVVTPLHAALNTAREAARGAEAHGTCGLGIGETIAYDLACQCAAGAGDLIGNFTVPADIRLGATALRFGDLRDKGLTLAKLRDLYAYAQPLIGGTFDEVTLPAIAKEFHEVASRVRVADTHVTIVDALEAGTVLFEGSQGVLLDENAGFHPHTTWTTTTPSRLEGLLRSWGYDPYVLGLTRSYCTRHGAGPFPTESAHVTNPEPHNHGGGAQGLWRQGYLDLTTLRYAATAAGGVDGVAVSHMDVTPGHAARWGTGEDQLTRMLGAMDESRTALASAATPTLVPLTSNDDLLNVVQDAAGAPVVLTAYGPARTDRRFL